MVDRGGGVRSGLRLTLRRERARRRARWRRSHGSRALSAETPKLVSPLLPHRANHALSRTPELTRSAPSTVGGGTGLDSPLYAVLPCDLRDLAALTTALQAHLDPALPTLLLAECVFVYVPPQDVSNLLGWFAQTFGRGACFSYDPFGLDDSFGKVMVRNLAVGPARTLPLALFKARTHTPSFFCAGPRPVAPLRPRDAHARLALAAPRVERVCHRPHPLHRPDQGGRDPAGGAAAVRTLLTLSLHLDFPLLTFDVGLVLQGCAD